MTTGISLLCSINKKHYGFLAVFVINIGSGFFKAPRISLAAVARDILGDTDMSFTGWEVRSRAAFSSPRSQFFTTRTGLKLANNILTLLLNRVARRLLAIDL